MPNAQVERQQRQEQLHSLLRSGIARTQQALVDELKLLGISATQSSVSRDLKELGAVKTASGYTLPAASVASDEAWPDVGGLVRGMQAAGPNLLVIRTGAGAAQRVALALDRSGWPEMVGNIGGDDTVFVATATLAQQKRLIARLDAAFGH
jgi:transcriptional regulator of arginine metabolism